MVDGTHNLLDWLTQPGFPEVDNPLIGTTLPPLLDPTYLTQVQISYPAADFPMTTSIDAGVTALSDAILALGGAPFMLCGYSQGAGVCSQVLKAMQSGSLTSVYDDCIGAVMFGDICREAGSIASWLTDPGGHGIWTGQLNTDTPAWWMDCAIPLDAACTVRDDVLYEVDLGTFFATFIGSFPGSGDRIRFLLDNLGSGVQMDVSAFGDCATWCAAVAGLIPFPTWMINTVTHGLYYNTCPEGSTSTYAELAANWINATAAAA